MTSNKAPREHAAKVKEAWNSHDLDRIMALYSEDVIFKSPRVRTVSGEESGILRGNRWFAITGDGYWSGDLISIVQWVMYSLASIASPWNIALPTGFTVSSL